MLIWEGSWEAEGQASSALLQPLMGQAISTHIPTLQGTVSYRLSGLKSAEVLCVHAGGSASLEL